MPENISTLLPEPDLIFYNKADRTVNMEFHKDPQMSGEYQVRGSVCWPILDVKTSLMTGSFLVAGRRCDNNVIYIFRSKLFTNINPISDSGGKILFDGCARWLSNMWTAFCSYRYFWRQDVVTHGRWQREVRSSAMVKPTPVFISVLCDNPNVAHGVIWEKIQAGQLIYDSEIKKAIDIYQVSGDAEIPSVIALQTLLLGFDKYPFRRKNRESSPDVSIFPRR